MWAAHHRAATSRRSCAASASESPAPRVSMGPWSPAPAMPCSVTAAAPPPPPSLTKLGLRGRSCASRPAAPPPSGWPRAALRGAGVPNPKPPVPPKPRSASPVAAAGAAPNAATGDENARPDGAGARSGSGAHGCALCAPPARQPRALHVLVRIMHCPTKRLGCNTLACHSRTPWCTPLTHECTHKSL